MSRTNGPLRRIRLTRSTSGHTANTGNDPPDLTRRAFTESFARLLEALEPVSDHELFADDCWTWLDGEALVEMILWDTARHYDGHRDHLEALRLTA